jgi:hypothetical protein
VIRRAVLLSPYFPPSTLAGVHRARHLAKHLPAAGWEPIVLCVDETNDEQRLDHALAALVPERVQTVRVGALPARFTRPFGIGEISLRAWGPLRRALFQLLETQRINVVLITGAPFYPMLLTPAIKRRFGVPVILDFQDPWVSAWGAAQPMLSKPGLSHALATWLEPRAVRSADFLTSVSDTQNAEMCARYPFLHTDRMAGIPIGGDRDDFDAIRAAPQGEGEDDLEPGKIHLSYVGTFLPRSGALLQALFRAFARLRAAEPALGNRVRLNFVGTSNQPNDDFSYRVSPIAKAMGVADAVVEIPRRLPYLRALGILCQSHGVLLIGSDEPHYTASKIYPGLMCGRPFLSVFHRASSAHEILSASGGGRAFAFTTPDELSALEVPLAEALRTLVLAPDSLGIVNPTTYAPYEASAISRRFADIFDSISTTTY